MNITKRNVFGVLSPSILIILLAFVLFYEPDPFAKFETECEESTEIVQKTAEDGTVTYHRLLNSVEKGYVISADGKPYPICIQIDSGAGGFTIDIAIADALGLKERGKVIPVRSANGRVKRKSVDVVLSLAGKFYPNGVATKTDRTGLTYAANAGRDYMPEGAVIDPTREESEKEEVEAEEKTEN